MRSKARWQNTQAIPHSREDKLGGTTGEQDRNPAFQHGKLKTQNPWLKKFVRAVVAGETPSLTQEFTGEAHRVLKCTHTNPPANQCLKGHNLWEASVVMGRKARIQQAPFFPP